MQIKKEQLFTVATSLGVIKNALRQIVIPVNDQKADTIIYNSFMKAVKEKSNGGKK